MSNLSLLACTLSLAMVTLNVYALLEVRKSLKASELQSSVWEAKLKALESRTEITLKQAVAKAPLEQDASRRILEVEEDVDGLRFRVAAMEGIGPNVASLSRSVEEIRSALGVKNTSPFSGVPTVYELIAGLDKNQREIQSSLVSTNAQLGVISRNLQLLSR